MKILSLILSFLLFFPSYLLSFLPSNITEDFTLTGNGINNGAISVNGEDTAVAAKTEGAVYTYGFSAYRCGWFNYFGLKYNSDAYMKGEIVYTGKSGEYCGNSAVRAETIECIGGKTHGTEQGDSDRQPRQ